MTVALRLLLTQRLFSNPKRSSDIWPWVVWRPNHHSTSTFVVFTASDYPNIRKIALRPRQPGLSHPSVSILSVPMSNVEYRHNHLNSYPPLLSNLSPGFSALSPLASAPSPYNQELQALTLSSIPPVSSTTKTARPLLQTLSVLVPPTQKFSSMGSAP